MKLAGLDKSIARREDGAVADAVAAWRGIVGRVRTAVKTAQLAAGVSEVKESGYVVRSVSASEGGVTAPKWCILCGLKREERVKGVDEGVEDSFGEWWTEHWGHWECAVWWGTWEGRLKEGGID